MQPGARLGPYEIVALVGAGGMGEVYRARDTRLGRDVAIKVLPAQLASDPDRLRRFEHEARAVAALSHPNILALYDVGSAPVPFRAEGEESAGSREVVHYLVSELLEGESLRNRLKGEGLTVRKAVEIGIQIAQGLAAAHEKGIVHRDLKPANVFVTKDGHVKILDFGIAKLTRPDPGPQATALTPEPSTETGALMGTVGYMSPEQVRGLPADHRTDIFSFGCVLYEMLSGRTPFRKDTTAETMTAILHEEPAELARPALGVSPALDRVVRRCLEKEASQRFDSAHDVALALDAVAVTGPVAAPVAPEPSHRSRRAGLAGLGLFLLVGSCAGLFLWTRQSVKAPLPAFTRLTFRHGLAWMARFTPDGQGVIYTGDWEGKGQHLYSQKLGVADARTFGFSGLIVATSGGEMAVLLEGGTLARAPLEGGTPREVAEHVSAADWARDGSHFAIVRDVGGRQRLECPIGKVLYETTGIERISNVRLSPEGDRIAYIDHRVANESVAVVVMDLSGQRRTLSKGWAEAFGLAWWPDGREVWFTATNVAEIKELHAVTLAGKERAVLRLANDLFLLDISSSGRVLVDHGKGTFELRGRMAGDSAERDLSWLDGGAAVAIASDGSQMLLQAAGEGGGQEGSIYLWRAGVSPPVRLGKGFPLDASPDWKWALCMGWPVLGGNELRLVPTGAGEPLALPHGAISRYLDARFHPDGKQVLSIGSEAGRPPRLFLQDFPDGPPRPISPEGVSNFTVSQDGTRVAFVARKPGEPMRLYVRNLPDGPLRTLGPVGEMGGIFASVPISPDGQFVGARPAGPRAPFVLYPADGGAPRPVPALEAGDESFIWTEDGRSLFVQAGGSNLPIRVVRVDLRTGRREPWLDLAPPDLAGVTRIALALVKSNGRYYAYTYERDLYNLYLIDGLK